MKRFKFKFDKLLMIREYMELKAKLNFAAELQKKLKLEHMNREMQKSILKTINASYHGSQKIGDKINISQLSLENEYIDDLMSMISINDDKKQALDTTLNKLRNKLAEASKEKKIIDELKNKAFQRYLKEYKKDELKSIDEAASQLTLNKI